MKFFYLGPKGSFSEIIVRKSFQQKSGFIGLDSFVDIVERTKKETASIGVIAIENSTSSSVHSAVDLMFDNQLFIVGEAYLQIRLNLIGNVNTSFQNIIDIYSHPQAILQCQQFIKKHGLKSHQMKSTSEAAGFVKKKHDPNSAAIGSEYLAELLGLKIIGKDIADEKNNLTRWIFVSKSPESITRIINKITYIFKVKHEPGSLVKVLNRIAKAKGNLTKIESRPLPGTNWEYGFWIDIEIPENQDITFDRIMEEETLEFRTVGKYCHGKLFVT